jgi:hypothetical protein
MFSMHSHYHRWRDFRVELRFDRDKVRAYNHERRVDRIRMCVVGDYPAETVRIYQKMNSTGY